MNISMYILVNVVRRSKECVTKEIWILGHLCPKLSIQAQELKTFSENLFQCQKCIYSIYIVLDSFS